MCVRITICGKRRLKNEAVTTIPTFYSWVYVYFAVIIFLTNIYQFKNAKTLIWNVFVLKLDHRKVERKQPRWRCFLSILCNKELTACFGWLCRICAAGRYIRGVPPRSPLHDNLPPFKEGERQEAPINGLSTRLSTLNRP